MKFFLSLLFVLSITTFSYSQDKLYADIERAFQQGDEKTILANVSDKLLFEIDKKESVYSKSQAEMILRDFFAKNKPSSFKLIFKGKAKGNSAYAVGIMESGTKTFRITMTLKESGTLFKIEQLAIEGE